MHNLIVAASLFVVVLVSNTVALAGVATGPIINADPADCRAVGGTVTSPTTCRLPN